MSFPSIPHASRRIRPATFDRRVLEELCELLERLFTQIRYAATAFVVGMNMDCEAPCWSEIANDERAGQRADIGDVTIMTANAGMIEMNFIDRLPFHMIAAIDGNGAARAAPRMEAVVYTTPSIGRRVWKSLRIAKPAAAAARCLSVCPLRIEPAE